MADLTQIAVEPSNFAKVIANDEKPVLVDFWAPWCGTCKLMAPSVIRLAAEKSAEITVVSLNIEHGQDLALAHDVMSLPTIIIFKNGEELKRLTGMKSYDTLVSEIQVALNSVTD